MAKSLRVPRRWALLAAVAVLASAGAVAAASLDKGGAPNSESGLTDSQRQAIYDQNTAAWQAKLSTWYANLNVGALDFQTLPRVGMMADFVPPTSTTLQEAIAGADAVVTVTATSLTTAPGVLPTSVVMADVTSVAKGNATSPIRIEQPGGIVPTLDWTGVQIEDADPFPILRPGDQAVLFLVADSSDQGSYRIEGYVGEYIIDAAGSVTPVVGNPFASSVANLSYGSFEALITAAGS